MNHFTHVIPPAKSSFKKKTDIYPAPSSNFNLAVFLKLVSRDIQALKIKSPSDNLTPGERKALTDLTNQMEITVKPSDKGGNTVIMDNEH